MDNLDDVKKWDRRIYTEKASAKELNQYCRIKTKEFELDQYEYEGAFEVFYEDFYRFTKEHFSQFTTENLQILRRILQRGDVYLTEPTEEPEDLTEPLYEEVYTSCQRGEWLFPAVSAAASIVAPSITAFTASATIAPANASTTVSADASNTALVSITAPVSTSAATVPTATVSATASNTALASITAPALASTVAISAAASITVSIVSLVVSAPAFAFAFAASSITTTSKAQLRALRVNDIRFSIG